MYVWGIYGLKTTYYKNLKKNSDICDKIWRVLHGDKRESPSILTINVTKKKSKREKKHIKHKIKLF